jgi:hypothetical protein
MSVSQNQNCPPHKAYPTNRRQDGPLTERITPRVPAAPTRVLPRCGRYVVGIQLLGLSVEVTSTLDAFLRRLLQGVRERVVPPARQFQPVGAHFLRRGRCVRLGMQPPQACVQAAQRRSGKIPVTGVEAEALVNHHRFVNQACGLAATWARDGKFPAGQTLPGLPLKPPKYKRPLEQIEGPCFANSD